MEIPSKYNPAEVEDKWYKFWLDNGFFHSEPDSREPYVIVIPPPNVTGVLHMGHMLNNTIQDILVRRARMLGKNACWVPGTDHASIATEAKVVNKLREQGINKFDISRDEFLKHAWEWTHKHGGIILQQLRKLGASCDWDRTAFTMDEARSESVIRVFVDLYNKGLIYRGVRMVNWDPKAKTALSDEEVNYKEVQSKLYYIRYKIEAPSDSPQGGEKRSPGYQTARNSSYHLLKELAEERKKLTTDTEIVLWECLSGKKLEGYKFRRQHIIDEFIVDFVCLKESLVIEIDGEYHNKPEIQEADKLRTEILERLGYRVIRFTNQEVLGNIDGVLDSILSALKSSPLEGEKASSTPPSGDGGLFVTIATTRPETILGDTAVCVNPADERFAHLKGKRVLVPLINRSIPIIEDDYVDMEFGTGCLKITPAHDINDYEIGLRYNLPSIDIFNDDGTLSEQAQLFVGEDRFAVRDKIIPELEKSGNLVKIENYTNKIGFSERTDVIIEPKLSAQWFLKMEKLAQPALENVLNDNIRFHPAKFKNIYRHWMENIKDWCISRQLWWGHRIPVWYIKAPFNSPEGGDWGYVVAETEEQARELAIAKFPFLEGVRGGFSLEQDSDVLDTWFSSWLWPISVFDGIRLPDSDEIKYYYPTSDLVTAPDIIFFWVARMIISGYEYRGEFPYRNVYYTGMVRDQLGRKMSKQLGNSPDPLHLIEKFGADGVRVGMLLCSPAGSDLLFDESLPQQGAGFATKIWNAFRLVKNWEVSDAIPQPEHSALAIEWFNHKLNEVTETLNQQFEQFRISEALMTVYTVVRDEFSSWLLEIVKPAYQQPIDAKTYNELVGLFDKVLRLLHPFMPFITEEIWQLLSERKLGESIMVAEMPSPQAYDAGLLTSFENLKEAVSGVRKIRLEKNIANKESLALFVQIGEKGFEEKYNSVLIKLANISSLEVVTDEVKGAASFRVKSTNYYIPLEGLLDAAEELKKLEDELAYTKGFLATVMKKLSNERFVAGAPTDVVEKEQAKKADAEAKIKILEERIGAMK
jgi:valyl-tRNA synthetase